MPIADKFQEKNCEMRPRRLLCNRDESRKQIWQLYIGNLYIHVCDTCVSTYMTFQQLIHKINMKWTVEDSLQYSNSSGLQYSTVLSAINSPWGRKSIRKY